MIRRRRHTISIAAGIFVLCAGSIRGEIGKRISPDEIRWPSGTTHGGIGTSHAEGVETVVLDGDPAKAGLYTIRLKVPPNTRIEAHSHRDNRSAVVLSGTWFIGYGPAFDGKLLRKLPAGSYYSEPASVDHFAMTKSEAVIIQITGFGPTSTKYRDERLDPVHK